LSAAASYRAERVRMRVNVLFAAYGSVVNYSGTRASLLNDRRDRAVAKTPPRTCVIRARLNWFCRLFYRAYRSGRDDAREGELYDRSYPPRRTDRATDYIRLYRPAAAAFAGHVARRNSNRFSVSAGPGSVTRGFSPSGPTKTVSRPGPPNRIAIVVPAPTNMGQTVVRIVPRAKFVFGTRNNRV